MANNNDVVLIDLDITRELRYGHKALKNLSAKTGLSMETMSEGNFDFNELETILFYGLKADDVRNHGGKLELEHMEDVLDYAPSVNYYVNKMMEAFGIAFGSTAAEGNGQTEPGKQERNEPTIGKQPSEQQSE